MKKKLVIIGGGIVGLSCAYYANREGLDVTVIDPGRDESRASYGNAGVIALCETLPLASPQLMLQIPKMLLSPNSPLSIRWKYLPKVMPWMMRFALASLPSATSRSINALQAILSGAAKAHLEISDAASVSSMLEKSGWMKASERPQGPSSLGELKTLIDLGVQMENLSGDQIRDMAPGFAQIFKSATLYTDCYKINNPGRYLHGIAKACSLSGVRIKIGEVSAFDFSGGRVTGVKVGEEFFKGDFFVLSAGARSKHLAKAIGHKIPLDTERGYHIMCSGGAEDLIRAPVLWDEKSVVMTQMEQGLRITSSVEFAGLEAPPDYRNIERTFRSIRACVPSLSNAAISSRWLGFRPSIPDSVPVVGASKLHPNCFMAFGHGHLGLTLGPVTGEIIAAQIAGKPMPFNTDGLSPNRFI